LGTDIYTDDSYIPKAAVNAGVIKDGQTKTVYSILYYTHNFCHNLWGKRDTTEQ